MNDDNDNHQDEHAAGLFGRHIRRLRKSRGLTQEQLAERSNLAADTICRLERSDFSPSLKTLRKLAGGLKLPLSEIFEAIEVGELDPEIVELTQLLRSHPRVPVSAVTSFLRALLASGWGSEES